MPTQTTAVPTAPAIPRDSHEGAPDPSKAERSLRERFALVRLAQLGRPKTLAQAAWLFGALRAS